MSIFKSSKPCNSKIEAQIYLMERLIDHTRRKGFAVERIGNIIDRGKAEIIVESYQQEGAKVRSLQNEDEERQVVTAFGPDNRVPKIAHVKR